MEIQLFQHHPLIGYTFIPNLKTRIDHEGGGFLVRTNGHGFRCEHEFTKSREPGKFRALLFGDSFTAGDGVSNKNRYGDLLEKMTPGLEVYNFALPGTATDQHYLVWREIAKEFEHDLVIIAVQVENIRRVVSRYRLAVMASGNDMLLPKPYFEIDGGELQLKGVPVPERPISVDDLPESERDHVDTGGRLLWLRKLVNKMGGPVKEILQKVSAYQPLPEYDDANGHEWLLMKTILKAWARELPKPGIVMPIPLYHYVEETAPPDAYRARFAEVADWPGVTLHDPLPDYYALPKQERRDLRFETDIHPTPAHHSLLASSLGKVVRAFVDHPVEGVAAK
jgi:carbamoyltransferase